jgi:predicted RNA binding protein YcfA (HicA-like mRNA interferase family)
MGNWNKFLKKLEKRGWKLVHEDDHSLIFEHKTFGKVIFAITATQDQEGILEKLEETELEKLEEMELCKKSKRLKELFEEIKRFESLHSHIRKSEELPRLGEEVGKLKKEDWDELWKTSRGRRCIAAILLAPYSYSPYTMWEEMMRKKD